MKFNIISIMVNDQESALKFYTEILGFEKKKDISMGKYRWLTVISPEGYDDVELVLEPMEFEPAKVYQKALFDAGMPLTIFDTKDINADYKRLSELGVKFRSEPQNMGVVTTVIFEDTCGNLIILAQQV